MLNFKENINGEARAPKTWLNRLYDKDRAAAVAAELDLPAGIADILLQRGLSEAEQVHAFLFPALGQLPAPLLMKGMREAVSIVARAVVHRQPIMVYGDYDVDGTTGAAVLVLFLRTLGLEVLVCQPHRLTQGYGLHHNMIDDLLARAPGGVLVTVDCGISSVEAVAAARQGGMTVIVTDHHQPPGKLPAAHAILNPLQAGCGFPFKQLAGVGVAFYLTMGIRSHLKEQGFWQGREAEMPNLREYLDLVAVGTIADMVPLLGPNRIFARAGLEVLQEARRPGFSCLLETAGVLGKRLSAEDVGYRLGPRINAAGRTGDPGRALELLLTSDFGRARELAGELEEANRCRQALEKEMFQQAVTAAADILHAGGKSLVLSGADWHAGVLGIVASRLLNRYYRTTILLTEKDGLLKGSGRSIPALDLYGTLGCCQDLLVQYGGHANAAGLALRPENLKEFQERFEAEVATRLKPEDLQPKLLIDGLLGEELFHGRFLEYYLRLPPFGIGNPEPVFGGSGCRLLEPRVVAEKHLKFFWPHNGGRLQGIGFGFGYLLPQLLQEATAGVAVSLRLNEYRGKESWQLNLVDLVVEEVAEKRCSQMAASLTLSPAAQ
jgi:single-stranded-DNA-specific exonuclease